MDINPTEVLAEIAAIESRLNKLKAMLTPIPTTPPDMPGVPVADLLSVCADQPSQVRVEDLYRNATGPVAGGCFWFNASEALEYVRGNGVVGLTNLQIRQLLKRAGIRGFAIKYIPALNNRERLLYLRVGGGSENLDSLFS